MMEELSFEESLEKLEEIVNKLENGDVPLDEAIEEFTNAMNEDLNTSKALAILFKLVDRVKKDSNPQVAVNTLVYLGSTLGFDFSLANKEVSDEELTEIVKPLYSEFNLDENLSAKEVLDEIIKLRKQSRDNKDWAESDRIRDLLLAHKVQLKDSKEGTTWAIL